MSSGIILILLLALRSTNNAQWAEAVLSNVLAEPLERRADWQFHKG